MKEKKKSLKQLPSSKPKLPNALPREKRGGEKKEEAQGGGAGETAAGPVGTRHPR